MPVVSESHFTLDRCPHCGIDRPTLRCQHTFRSNDYLGGTPRFWGVYVCARCGGVTTATAANPNMEAAQVFPVPGTGGVDASLPDRARAYLQQAMDSVNAPAGAVILAASAVDAMLKNKGLTNGTLNARIDEAAKIHLITNEMAQWAHEVRLDANDQRHADENAPLPGSEDARRSIEFASALGQFLFVLPARVQRGLKGGP